MQKKVAQVLQLVVLVWMSPLLLVSGGCGTPRLSQSFGTPEGVFDQPSARHESSSGAWSVLLEIHRGQGAEVRAVERARAISSSTGLPSVRAEARGHLWMVLSGSYQDPAGEATQRALERARGSRVGGERVFAEATLIPPPPTDPSDVPEWDLRSARRGVGRDENLYTLQIGAYGRADRGSLTERQRRESRSAAERAVADLRREGYEAFYLHDANLSVVTVGVFGDADLGLTQGSGGYPSPEFTGLKRAFPNNLFNGRGIREADPTNPGATRLQASQAVEIPR